MGDTISFTLQGKKQTIRIGNVFHYYRSVVIVNPNLCKGIKTLGYNKIYFRIASEEQKEQIREQIRKEQVFLGIQFEQEMWEKIESSNQLLFRLYGIGIVTIVILNYFVLRTIIGILFYENEQDMKTMKLLGVKIKNIAIFIKMNLSILYMSVLIGMISVIPCVLVLLKRINVSFGKDFQISLYNMVYTSLIVGCMCFVLLYQYRIKIRKLKVIG